MDLNLLGHVFYAFLAVGMFLLAHKNGWGWVFRCTGELGWVWIGWEMQMSSIWIWGGVFASMDIFGMYKWGTTRRERLAVKEREQDAYDYAITVAAKKMKK